MCHSVCYIYNFLRVPDIDSEIFTRTLFFANSVKTYLSYDVASGSEITPCNKIDKTLVVYRFTGNVMTSITTVRT